MKRNSMLLGLLLVTVLSTPIAVRAAEVSTFENVQQAEERVEVANVLESGVWNNVAWTMYSDGYLLLEAQGETDEYAFDPAWLRNYAETITSAKIVGSTITSTNGWFKGCSNLTSLDTSEWDMTVWATAREMFRECTALKTLQVSGWDTGHLRDVDWMFYQCSGLETLDVSEWDMSSLVSAMQMFGECSSLTSLDVGNWGCTSLYNIGQMFENCTALEYVNPGNWDISGLSDIDMLFSGCESLKTLDLNGWDTSNLYSISGTFQGCKSLETVSLSNWDTTGVRDIGSLFNGCESLKSADVSDWNLPDVTDIRYLFYGCKLLKEVDLSKWTLGNVDRAFCMFYGCENLESVKVGSWDLSSATQFSSMFRDCKKLKSVDISGWTTGLLTNLDYMFSGCESLESLKLPEWDTGSVVSAAYLFYNCKNLELELDFDGVNIEHLTSMFQGCSKMTGNVTLGRYEAVYDAMNCFTDAATAENAAIYVTYRGLMRRAQLEQIIATKSENSHIYIKEVAPTSFAIEEEPEISIEVGETYIIDLSMAPADANGTVWCSDVDSVSADGTDSGVIFYKVNPYNRQVYIEGLKEGIVSLDIGVEYDDNVIYLQDSCVIEVGNPSETCTRLKKITLVPEEMTLTKIGESRQLTVERFPKYAEMPELEWTEHNGVVRLSDTGVITAVKNGEGYVYAKTKDGSMHTSCTIYVEDPAAVIVPTTGMVLDKEELLFAEIGDSYRLTPIFTPANATDKRMEWVSFDSSVVTVDANGVVTAVSEGTTQIYAWALDGMYRAICNVTVARNGAQVQDFVERMYTIVLNRAADENGVTDWTLMLLNKEADGAILANGFVNSDEFIARGLSDSEYISVLYRAFLNREADESGIQSWTQAMHNGLTRQDVLNGFINSDEFKGLCEEAGIRATFTQEDLVRNFVRRMYTVVLNRSADESGLADWTKMLMNKEADGATIANGFVNSDEFNARGLSNKEYITVMYSTFLNRVADEGGIQTWMTAFENGATRQEIMDGFVKSEEFGNICKNAGIIAVFTQEDYVRSFVERMYTVALNRAADVNGVEDWTRALINKEVNGAQMAAGFIDGEEFKARGLSDSDFVDVLYRTFFNREADVDKSVWTNALAEGWTRREVLKGFANSDEFGRLCDRYGIVRGELD